MAKHLFQKGNKYAQGLKHTDEWKQMMHEKMKGNSNGFKKGQTSPRKGKKSSKSAWNKGLKMPEKSGANHWNWVLDRTKLKDDHRDRGGQLHREWTRQVKNRDNWKCKISNQDCNGRIEAHHILSWCEFPELRYEINNGITLCHFHHPRKKNEETKLIPMFRDIIDFNIPYLKIEE